MSVRNVTPTPVGVSGETYQEKFVRKFKEQPLVPIGAGLTTVALVTAMVRMRQGQAQSMNYWLRARVIFQGLTIAAVVGGSYVYGQTKQQKEARTAAEQEVLLAHTARERDEFHERLRAAEEAHRLEEEMGKGGAGMSGFGVPRSETLSPPSGMSSAPAGVEKVHSSVGEAGGSSSTGLWGWLGFGSSSDKKQ